VSRSVRRRSVLLGVAICAVLAGPVSFAQASDNTLRATLNSYAPKIVTDESAVKSGLSRYGKHKVKPLVHALNHEVADLHALKSALAHDSGSSAKGRKAKADIVKGLALIAKAYTALRHDVQLAHGGPVPSAKVSAAVHTDLKGRAKLLAGLKLLK
jgi:precorrin isomerase